MQYHLDWLRRDVKEHQNDSIDRKAESIDELKDRVIQNTKAYMDYEYYRKASIARAVHEELLATVTNYTQVFDVDLPDERSTYPYSVKASITEHMRWNAYMRTMGYRYSEKRNNMAKLHNDLTLWSRVPDADKPKDKKIDEDDND